MSASNTQTVSDAAHDEDGSEHVLLEFPQDDETVVDYTATVLARNNVAETFAADLRATFERTAGVMSTVRNLPPTNVVGTWASAEFRDTGSSVQLVYTGSPLHASSAKAVMSAQNVAHHATLPDLPLLPMTLWLSAPYSGAPYPGRASAGPSGTVALNSVDPPTTGPESVPGNGLTSARFVGGVPQFLAPTNPANDLAVILDSTGDGSFWIAALIDVSVLGPDPGAGNEYLSPAILKDNGGGVFTVFVNAGGFGCERFNGGGYNRVAVPITPNAKHPCQIKYDGTLGLLYARIDDEPWSAPVVAGGNMSSAGRPIVIGRGLSGDIWELFPLKRLPTETESDQFILYCNMHHGTAFSP